jgi:hypothetical protein
MGASSLDRGDHFEAFCRIEQDRKAADPAAEGPDAADGVERIGPDIRAGSSSLAKRASTAPTEGRRSRAIPLTAMTSVAAATRAAINRGVRARSHRARWA